MFARHVLEVLYSPIKAFDKIIKKPDVKGPLLILVLIVLTNAIAQYAFMSKLFIKTETTPNDQWTESISLWTSNGDLSLSSDRVIGNHSIESSILNGTGAWMKIDNIGTFDCSQNKECEAISFRIKWIHQETTFPSSNATLHLLSGSESRYFSLNLIDLISNSSNRWANLTVSTGSNELNWSQSDSPNWGHITGLELELGWSAAHSANLSLKIDDLYFAKYVPLGAEALSYLIMSSSTYTAIVFFVEWAVYTVSLLVIAKLFGKDTGPWKGFFITIGFFFSVTVVYNLITAASFWTFPVLKLPMKAFPPANVEELESYYGLINEKWSPALTFRLYQLFPYLVVIWMAVLSAIAIHSLCKITWKEAATISAIASFINLFSKEIVLSIVFSLI